MKILPLALSLTGFLCLASANAQLDHRYSMTTDGTDSVGGASGQISGNATFAGGLLTTTGAAGDYLALPTTVGTGITGDFSVETFVSIANNPNDFSSLFSLSSPGNRNFFLVNPSRPNAGGSLSANFQEKDGAGVNGAPDTEVDIRPTNGAAFAFGATEQDLAISYVAATNIVTLYLNGTQIGSGSIAAALGGTSFNLQTLTSGGTNGINGGGPFGDASINGSTDDFRIFGNALTPAQAAALDVAGPNASNVTIAGLVPEPSPWATTLLGVAALCGLQRFRRRQA